MPDILFDMSLNFIYTIIFHNLLYDHFKSLSDVCAEYYIYYTRYSTIKCIKKKQTKTSSITSEISGFSREEERELNFETIAAYYIS